MLGKTYSDIQRHSFVKHVSLFFLFCKCLVLFLKYYYSPDCKQYICSISLSFFGCSCLSSTLVLLIDWDQKLVLKTLDYKAPNTNYKAPNTKSIHNILVGTECIAFFEEKLLISRSFVRLVTERIPCPSLCTHMWYPLTTGIW